MNIKPIHVLIFAGTLIAWPVAAATKHGYRYYVVARPMYRDQGVHEDLSQYYTPPPRAERYTRHVRRVAEPHRAQRVAKHAVPAPVHLVRHAEVAQAPTESVFNLRFLGFSGLVETARRYIGRNPTSMTSLWCARFMNLVLRKSGYSGTDSDAASSFAHYGHRVDGPVIGAIAVIKRNERGGGHVGIVSGVAANGNPILVQGNHGHKVAEAPVSRKSIYAYRMPVIR